MDHIDTDDLHQIEWAAQDAPAAMLRYLIRAVERRLARDGAGAVDDGHAQILLLKLHHLLTPQQVHAAHQSREAGYLAPDLVIADKRRRAGSRARRAG